ncbi:hypothetical protein ACFYO1_01650 [Nocardia sp. NPDC006044]|uniref:hypothetical protein n=1 Tax=Nocardia sp. NPDC006044 TaxID=3364306 RepID=UPI0036C715B7
MSGARILRWLITSTCVLLAIALCPAANAEPGQPDGGPDVASGTSGAGANTVLRQDPQALAAVLKKDPKLGIIWIWQVKKVIEEWLDLEAPPMCFAPGTADNGQTGVVGLHSWAWICPDQIRKSTVGPKYLSLSNILGLYGINLQAYNPLVGIDWGDGSPPSVCPNLDPLVVEQPFAPYNGSLDALSQPGAGDVPSPSCGHFIGKSSATAPNGTFTVTATSAWVVYAQVWVDIFGYILQLPFVVPWPKMSTYQQRIGEAQALDTIPVPR